MGEVSLNIRMVENGVIVRYSDPKIQEANREEDSEWQDPDVELVFKDVKEAMPEVHRILKTLTGEDTSSDEYESAFEEAATDE